MRYKPIGLYARRRSVVCVELTLAFSSTHLIAVRFVAKLYNLQQKCLNGQIGTCLLGTRWYNF